MKSIMKTSGILMILFGIVYAIVAILAYTGTITGILPGHESQEILIVILSAAVAIFALVGGILALAGNKGAARIVGIIFAVVGLVSLIYLQFTASTFNFADCIAMVLGIMLFVSAK